MKEKETNILLTGGHAATTGIAVVEEIKKRFPGAKIYWIGSQTAIEGSKISTIEYRVFPRIGVKFIPIIAGKLQTKFTWYTIPAVLKFPIGFFQAFWFLIKIKPKLVLSFGGYSSFPVVFWSWVFRIPLIVHEQTVVFGRAVMASAFFATKIALARAESLKYFSNKLAVVTGNPLMSNILSVMPKLYMSKPPVILVIGGSRGSNFINDLIMEMAEKLLPNFEIIHITGEHDFEKVEQFRDKLLPKLKENYKTYLSIDPLEIGSYYSQADIIISRSGANSVSEILFVKRPAILIPLPRTFMSEQVKNARYAESFGVATVLLEKEATAGVVMYELERIVNNWSKIVKAFGDIKSPDIEASKNVIDLMSKYV